MKARVVFLGFILFFVAAALLVAQKIEVDSARQPTADEDDKTSGSVMVSILPTPVPDQKPIEIPLRDLLTEREQLVRNLQIATAEITRYEKRLMEIDEILNSDAVKKAVAEKAVLDRTPTPVPSPTPKR